jgi:8-oxo-dGTP pyrophosphatase MutT (NUDIX family)
MLHVRINNSEYNQEVRKKIASRAVIVRNHKVAMMYSKKYDFYMTPGGGVEDKETLVEACIREAKEEAGFVVRPLEEVAILDSNYPRIRIEHHYFICEYVNAVETSQTKEEQDQELEIKWLTFEEMKEAFTKTNHIEKYDLWMRREYSVLSTLREYIKKE